MSHTMNRLTSDQFGDYDLNAFLEHVVDLWVEVGLVPNCGHVSHRCKRQGLSSDAK